MGGGSVEIFPVFPSGIRAGKRCVRTGWLSLSEPEHKRVGKPFRIAFISVYGPHCFPLHNNNRAGAGTRGTHYYAVRALQISSSVSDFQDPPPLRRTHPPISHLVPLSLPSPTHKSYIIGMGNLRIKLQIYSIDIFLCDKCCVRLVARYLQNDYYANTRPVSMYVHTLIYRA